MMNKAKLFRLLSMNLAVLGFVLISGYVTGADAQTRDPFAKPGWARTKDSRAGAATGTKKTPPPVIDLGAPAIEQRIAYYKQMRENAAANGQPLPKVTSVLTLNEMSVTGIFRTPRGYAAMVEATPIRLSYTIYPGERFFDGQLVAVEENRLVFRKVTKMSNGKFVSSVENKSLRQFSDQAQIQGTAPVQGSASTAQPGTTVTTDGKPAVGPVVSPLDEMNRQVTTTEEAKGKPAKGAKKPVKVAKSNK
ncbi:MAG: hypothetical protein JNK51_09150 [Blastocatellia bacterium]|nr:hypothetical protein [Chloracidobacterium sp.]MBL8185080.1 hypothetical protein [Blastocatellia bacterium]HBE83080.1 hypothetical protein [Blastocatellia bacterium]HRJ87806.1 hypothetical protein [Pyrinomonadaceae bacterium]HRK50262.1 hypothetical protein [Pyrinomonadaceae bacterium]